MERCYTVEIPEVSYKQLEALARERSSKVQNELLEAIKSYIELRKGYANDSFFQIHSSGKSGLGDLSEFHDSYLYGDKSEK